jgi:peptidoglycan/xylan/chitin deacetylase (PgdA/CDA1 family)
VSSGPSGNVRTRTPAAPASPTAPAPTLACAGTDRELLPGAGRVVALTFDLGGNDAGVAAILRALATERLRATFFITGSWAREYPGRVREIAGAGHAIGNHTATHPHLTTLTDAQVRAQLADAEARLSALTGRTTRPLFRFPFGDVDARTLQLVNADGWCAYRWTVDTLGWKGTSGGTAGDVRSRVLAHLQPGEIVLMHGGGNPDDGTTYDADALPSVITALRARGYGFATLPR